MTKKIVLDKKDLVHLDIEFDEYILEDLSEKISELIKDYGSIH